MRSNSFSLSEFLTQKSIGLKRKNIMMAELRILILLDWQMRSITPFCFVQHFFEVCRPPRGLRRQTISQIIVETQDDIGFTTLTPSVVSASALLAAFWHLYPRKYSSYEDTLMSLEYLDKPELSICVALMNGMCARKQLWMETAEMDIMEGTSTRVQVRVQRQQPVVEPPHSSQQQPGRGRGRPSSSSVLPPIEEEEKEEEEEEEEVEGHRPGKEPLLEEEEEPKSKLVPIPEIQPTGEVPIMSLELKWVTDRELDLLLSRPTGLAGRVDDDSTYCLGFLPCTTSANACTVL